MLTRRKESDAYLAIVSRHHWSPQIAMKMDKVCSFQPLQLMKAAVLAVSYSTLSTFIMICGLQLCLLTVAR
jgi:hypothetical protein